MEEAIRKFLEEQLFIDFGRDVDDDSDLFQCGLMDSYSYVKLIRFVEATFEIKFGNEEILASVAVSLTGIADLVAKKMEHSVRGT